VSVSPNQLALFDMPPCRAGDVHCVTCGVPAINAREHYTVRDDVWPLDPRGGILCVGVSKDVSAAASRRRTSPMLLSTAWGGSARLRSRLGLYA
jgi:hypothetical protein